MNRSLLLFVVALPLAPFAAASPFSVSVSTDYFVPHRDVPLYTDFRMQGEVARFSPALFLSADVSNRVSVELAYRMVPDVTKHVRLAFSELVGLPDPSMNRSWHTSYDATFLQDAFHVGAVYRLRLSDDCTFSLGPLAAVEWMRWRFVNVPVELPNANAVQVFVDPNAAPSATELRAGGTCRLSFKLARRVDIFAHYTFMDSSEVPASFLGGGLSYRF